MSRKLRLFSAVGILLLVVSIGFNIAFALPGDTPEPGSDQDPLITKGYVDQTIGQLNQTILTLQGKQTQQQAQLDQLKADNAGFVQKLAAQDTVIKALQDELKGIKTQTPVKPSNPDTTTPASVKGTINTLILNVRSQANTTSSILAKAAKGEIVTIITKGAEWHKIKTTKGITGYVLAKYVTMK